EEVARRKPLLKSYRVKKALAFHPRTPRLATLRLLRDLYLMDVVQLTLLPGIPTELKRNAEDQLTSRLPQLPLGQKITLARRGPARLAGALLAEGHAQIVSIVLDNAYLTEAQVLKVLSREKLPPVVVREFASPGIVSESLRKYLLAEVQRRIRAGEKSSKESNAGPPSASNPD